MILQKNVYLYLLCNPAGYAHQRETCWIFKSMENLKISVF